MDGPAEIKSNAGHEFVLYLNNLPHTGQPSPQNTQGIPNSYESPGVSEGTGDVPSGSFKAR